MAEIKHASFATFDPRIAIEVRSAERAIIVCHIAYRTAESGGWFRCGRRGWQWLIAWKSEDSNTRDLKWLVEQGWLVRRQRVAQEGGLDRAEWTLGAKALPYFVDPAGSPQIATTPSPQNAETPSPQIATTPSPQNAATEVTKETTEETTEEKTPPKPTPWARSRKSVGTRSNGREDQWDNLIPLQLQTPEFVEAWHTWNRHRSSLGRGKTITEETAKRQLAKVATVAKTPAESIRWIDNAIERGWSGLFPPGGIALKSAPRTRAAADNDYARINRHDEGDQDGSDTQHPANAEWFDDMLAGAEQRPAM